jgi:hypothetical protein
MIESVSPCSLRLRERFDIFVKYQFARSILQGEENGFWRDAYLSHIQTLNGFTEIDQSGKPVKLGAEQFEQSFRSTIESIRSNGFDEEYAVPISKENCPLNGAHRIAACMALGIDVVVQRKNESFVPKWDYRFFSSGGFNSVMADAVAQSMVLQSKKMHVAFIFGSAFAQREDAIAKIRSFGNISYEKTVALSKTGTQNLIRVLYEGERWLGKRELGYIGASSKSKPCFPKGCPLKAHAVFFQRNDDLESLIRCKAEIREVFGVGNHSIHITDTPDEVEIISNWILNCNGINLLNNKRFGKFAAFEADLKQLNLDIDASGVDRKHVCVAGSGVMAAYGLRDSRDLDFIATKEAESILMKSGLKSNNAHLETYQQNPHEIIANPLEHFVYQGLKFQSIQSLAELKQQRGESKDKIDLDLINLILKDSTRLRRSMRIAHVFRLYANLRWLKSYVSHWTIRLGLRVGRVSKRK